MPQMMEVVETSFVLIDAEWLLPDVQNAIDTSPTAETIIVRREGGRYFYVFSRSEVLYRLTNLPPDWTVHAALNLHESGSVPMVGTQDDPAHVQGPSVVLDGGTVVGFVRPLLHAPPPDLANDAPDEGDGGGYDYPAEPNIRYEWPTEEQEASWGGPGEYESVGQEETVRTEEPVSAEPPVSASEPGSQPTPQPAASLPRFLTAQAQDRVALNEEFALMVQITVESIGTAPGQDAKAISVPGGATLQIDLYAPGFRIIGGSTQPLTVPATGDSPPLRFGLRAEKAGPQTIKVNAWNGSAYVGGLTVQVAVDAEPAAAAPPQSDMDMRDPEEGECTLEVTYDDQTKRWRFQLRGDKIGLLPSVYSDPLVSTYLQTVNDLIAQLNALARNKAQYNEKQAQFALKGLASSLYNNILPKDLKDALVGIRGEIRRLNIISPGDPMPWEILFLTDPKTGEGAYLTESAIVSRWRYGTPPCPKIGKTPAYVVVPKGAPAQATQEFSTVSGILGGANSIVDLDTLIDLVDNGQFGLLHFAAHNVNVPGVTGGTYVPFPPSSFPLAGMESIAEGRYRANSPLVFMNACTSAGASPLYTVMAGWADKFVACGSGAFVGSLWEVRDRTAPMFAEAFYGELCNGKNLGQAMAAGRGAIGPADPTRLAYTLYGNPLAKL